MAAGDDGDQRNGNKIQAKKITIRMKVAVDPNSDSSNTNIVANAHTFRVLLVVDTQPSGAAPTWAQIVENSPNNEGQLYVYNKLSSTGRFKTLMDKFITVPPSYVVFDGDNFHAYGNNKFFKKSIPLDFAIHYSDTTNNFTGIQKNNIFMIIASDASLSSHLTGVYNPKTFILHAASLRQAFAHCAIFPTAASSSRPVSSACLELSSRLSHLTMTTAYTRFTPSNSEQR